MGRSRELRTLLWLQWRLIRNTLRRGSRQDWERILGLAIGLVLAMPVFVAFAIALSIGYIRLPLVITHQLLSVILSLILLIWLTTPLAQASLTEPFDLPRLFPHPVTLRSLAIASLFISLFSIGFILTLPFLVGAWIGFARLDASILVNALALSLFLALLIVVAALVNDGLDLIAEDRRLRNIAVSLGGLPFIGYILAQIYFQARFIGGIKSGQASTALSSWELVRTLNPAHYLRFLPSGWAAEAMVSATQRECATALLYVALLLARLALAVALHIGLLRQLYLGNLVRWEGQNAKRQGKRGLWEGPRLPFVSHAAAARFWALVRIDLLNLQRNPMTARMLIVPLMFGLMAFLLQLKGIPTLIPALGLGVFLSYILAMNPGHNQLAVLDHRGLGALLLTPVPRLYILAAHNTAVLLTSLAGTVVVAGLVAILARQPLVLPAALLAAFLTGLPFVGVGNLTSVFVPYKVDLERGRAVANETRAPFLAMVPLTFGLPLVAAPPIALLVVPWVLYKPILALTVPLAFAYSIGSYVLLLEIAARGLARREEAILQAITEGR